MSNVRFLADLALFVEVAKRRNFSLAAVALGIPASTLSRRLSAFERELGFDLIHRSTRVFKLTDAGATCYAQSETLVAEAKRIQAEVTNSAFKVAGHIRVGVPFDLAQTMFLPLFSRYMLAHSDVTIEVLSISGHPNVIAENLDVSIMVGHQLRLPNSSFWSRRIGAFPRRLFASEDYLDRNKKVEDPADLVDHLCLRLVHGEPLSKWEFHRGREHRTVVVSGRATANSVGMLARLSKGGMGIALLSDSLARHPAFGDGLVRVLSDWEATPAHIFAVTPTKIQPTRVRKLVDFLKDEFSDLFEELSCR